MRSLRPAHGAAAWSLEIAASLLSTSRAPAIALLTVGLPAQSVPIQTQSLTLGAEVFLPGETSRALRFSPDGRQLASVGPLGDVALIGTRSNADRTDFDPGAVRKLVSKHPTPSPAGIPRVRFSSSGETLAVITHGNLTLWNTSSADMILDHPAVHGSALHISADSNQLTWSLDETHVGILTLDRPADRPSVVALPIEVRPEALALSPDGQQIAFADGKKVHTMRWANAQLPNPVSQPDITRTQTYDDWTLALHWTADLGLQRFGQGGYGQSAADDQRGRQIYGVQSQPDGARIALRHHNATRIRDTSTGDERRIEGPDRIALHPDGSRIARNRDEIIEILRGKDVLAIADPKHHCRPVQSGLSGDGRVIAATCRDNRLRAFKLTEGQATAVDLDPEMRMTGSFATQRERPEIVILQPAAGARDAQSRTVEYWDFTAPPAVRNVDSVALDTLTEVRGPWQVGDHQHRLMSWSALGPGGAFLDELLPHAIRSNQAEATDSPVTSRAVDISPDQQHFIQTVQPLSSCFPSPGYVRFLSHDGSEIAVVILRTLPHLADPPQHPRRRLYLGQSICLCHHRQRRTHLVDPNSHGDRHPRSTLAVCAPPPRRRPPRAAAAPRRRPPNHPMEPETRRGCRTHHSPTPCDAAHGRRTGPPRAHPARRQASCVGDRGVGDDSASQRSVHLGSARRPVPHRRDSQAMRLPL